MDKKLGLICNYYIMNYGSVLQSFALQKVLKDYNSNMEVIQYEDTPNLKNKIEVLLKIRLKECINLRYIKKQLNEKWRIKVNLTYKETIENRKLAFDKFIKKHFTLSPKYHNKIEVTDGLKEYSTIVLSSDQLWGPSDIIRNYHTLIPVPEQTYKITYATSFGVAELPKFLEKRVAKFIPRINNISVREESGAKIIKKVCGKDVQVVCDPTLLLTSDEWNEIQEKEPIIKEEYIFCYFLGSNKEHREQALYLKKLTGLKIVSLRHLEFCESEELEFADITPMGIDPGELINLIKNAKYILSDSFHVTIFSILNHKQFVVFDRYDNKSKQSRNTRIDNLLEKLDLKDRRIFDNKKLNIKLDEKIDFEKVDNILSAWRIESRGYLEKALKDAKVLK